MPESNCIKFIIKIKNLAAQNVVRRYIDLLRSRHNVCCSVSLTCCPVDWQPHPHCNADGKAMWLCHFFLPFVSFSNYGTSPGRHGRHFKHLYQADWYPQPGQLTMGTKCDWLESVRSEEQKNHSRNDDCPLAGNSFDMSRSTYSKVELKLDKYVILSWLRCDSIRC